MAQLTIRIDDDLKDQLHTLARNEGKTTSDVVRTLVKQYVQDRDRSTFLDTLWDRMRENAEAEGRTQADVDQIIDEVRREDR
jgi:predicted transcriptional regulator